VDAVLFLTVSVYVTFAGSVVKSRTGRLLTAGMAAMLSAISFLIVMADRSPPSLLGDTEVRVDGVVCDRLLKLAAVASNLLLAFKKLAVSVVGWIERCAGAATSLSSSSGMILRSCREAA
jgi:hypothetical protein